MVRFQTLLRMLVGALPALAGCGGNDASAREAPDVHDASRRGTADGVQRTALITDFHAPESVKYDPNQDVYFVSNINGFGSVKDNNGYISRVNAADPTRIVTFIQGGKNGVTLHAPKGMAIHGDTLWVTDIDVIRGFDRRGGAPLATIDFGQHGAVLLNDIAVGPDGSLHITDTGIQMTDKGVIYSGGDKLFVVDAGQRISVLASGPQLAHPNGITWDSVGKRWLIVSFNPFSAQVYTMRDGDTTRTTLVSSKARLDGIEALSDGRILYTSWGDSSVHLITGTTDRKLVGNLPSPADIGFDTKRNRVLVPLGVLGRVEGWTVK
jgi:sugar lactone lactonase YvrE